MNAIRQRRRGARAEMRGVVLAVCAALVAALGGQQQAAIAAGPPPQVPSLETRAFALVVGVNRGVDASASALRYADDDAVRFGDLFRAVGARAVVLATLDQNTSRVHPAAAAQAVPARLAQLRTAVERLADDVARARLAGQRTVFYFAYAGHGRVAVGSDGGSIALEDTELRGSEILTLIIDRVKADESHVIVDACNSYFLVLGRGPGGRRRPLEGFVQLGALAERLDVGLLLSTSSARDSHEWAAFQAGVFSQEVRSGLYGAADVDNDGMVSYGEIAAFVRRANDGVRNERYRPDLFARAPAGKGKGTGTGTLLDLRPALARRIEVAPGGGHQFLEDTVGVRLADFHNGTAVRLVRPGEGRLYLRRTTDDREYVLPEEEAVLQTAALTLQEPRSSSRNAANDAFAALFSSPFSGEAVADFQLGGGGVVVGVGGGSGGDDAMVDATASPRSSFWGRPKTVAGAGLTVLGVAAGAWGIATLVKAHSLRAGTDATVSQRQAAMINDTIAAQNSRGGWLLAGGATAAVGGALLLLWPDRPVDLSATDQAVLAIWRGRF